MADDQHTTNHENSSRYRRSSSCRAGLIYLLKHPISGEVRYIGYTSQTLAYRLERHLDYARHNRTHSRVVRWIRGLLAKAMTPIIELVEDIPPFDRWQSREIYWIAEYRARGARLCNHTNGGEGNVGWVASDETRARMSQSLKGRKQTPEQIARTRVILIERMKDPAVRAALSTKLKGRPRSPESIVKQSAAQRGRVNSPETRKKIGDSHRGKVRGPLAPERLAKRIAKQTKYLPQCRRCKARLALIMRMHRILKRARLETSMAWEEQS